jgi:hypothetical protein
MTGLVTDEDRTRFTPLASSAPCPDPATSIVGYARSAGVDVIVIGTHDVGMSRLYSAVWPNGSFDGAMRCHHPPRTRVHHADALTSAARRNGA